MSRTSDELGLSEEEYIEKGEQYLAELQTILRSGSHAKTADLLLDWLNDEDGRLKAAVLSMYCYGLELAINELLPKAASDYVRSLIISIRHLGEIIRENIGYE